MRKIPEAGERYEAATLQQEKACRYLNMKLPQYAKGDVKMLCIECLKRYLFNKKGPEDRSRSVQRTNAKGIENKKPPNHRISNM